MVSNSVVFGDQPATYRCNVAGEVVLKARNQKVVGQSEGHAGTTGMKKRITPVSTNALKAKINDIKVKILS